MDTKIYFPSYGAAMRYYRAQIVVLQGSRMAPREAQTTAVRREVDAKLNSGEIHIGKPDLKPGETLSIEDNRYHITEAAPICPRCNVARSERIPGNARRCLNCHCEWNITTD